MTQHMRSRFGGVRMMSHGYSHLSDAGAQTEAVDEALFHLNILRSSSTSSRAKLSTAANIFRFLLNSEVRLRATETMVTALVQSFRVNSADYEVCERLLLLVLVFIRNESLSPPSSSGVVVTVPVFSVELLQAVVALYYSLGSQPEDEGPTAERENMGNRLALKRKFSGGNGPASPGKMSVNSSSVESAASLWPSLYREFISSPSGRSQGNAHRLCDLVLNRLLWAVIQRLNGVSAAALNESEREDEAERDEEEERERDEGRIKGVEVAKRHIEVFQQLLQARPSDMPGSPGGTGERDNLCVLDVVLVRLCGYMHRLSSKLADTSTDDLQSEGLPEVHRYSTQLWLLLGLLQSSCFNYPSNQKYIAYKSLGMEVSPSKGVLSPTRSPSLSVSPPVAPVLVLRFLKTLHDKVFAATAGLSGEAVPLRAWQCDEENALGECFPDFVFYCEGEREGERLLQCAELYLECLKCLVTLTNDCAAACNALAAEPGAVTWLIAVLHRSLDERETHSANRTNGGADELVKERFVFDLSLYLTALVANLVEGTPAPGQSSLLRVCRFAPRKAFCDAFAFAGRERETERETQTLPQTIVAALMRESKVFLADLEASDAALLGQGWMEEGERDTEDVPVAEIVLSAHLSLLLHTVVYGRLATGHRGARKQDVGIGPIGTLSPEAAAEAIMLSDHVRASLPRRSWWLCVRVLKAYLALQGQSGVLLVENFVPCLNAIAHMDARDRERVSCSQSLSLAVRADGEREREGLRGREREAVSGDREDERWREAMAFADTARERDSQKTRERGVYGRRVQFDLSRSLSQTSDLWTNSFTDATPSLSQSTDSPTLSPKKAKKSLSVSLSQSATSTWLDDDDATPSLSAKRLRGASLSSASRTAVSPPPSQRTPPSSPAPLASPTLKRRRGTHGLTSASPSPPQAAEAVQATQSSSSQSSGSVGSLSRVATSRMRAAAVSDPNAPRVTVISAVSGRVLTTTLLSSSGPSSSSSSVSSVRGRGSASSVSATAMRAVSCEPVATTTMSAVSALITVSSTEVPTATSSQSQSQTSLSGWRSKRKLSTGN